MTILVSIAASIALLAVAAACIYSVLLMKDARKLLSRVEGSVGDTIGNLVPLLENTSVITGKIRTLIEDTGGEMTKLKGAVDSLVNAVEDLANLGRRIKTRIEPPAMDAAGYVAALSKGLKAFMAFFQG